MGDAEQIDTQIKTEKKLNAWQEFCQQKRLEGVGSFADIAQMWKKQKDNKNPRPVGTPDR